MMVAAAGLARIAPESPEWSDFADRVALSLASMEQHDRSQWEKMLRPVSHHLRSPALKLLRSCGPHDQNRWLAASQLAFAHAGRDLDTLVEVLLEGHPHIFHAALDRCESLGLPALDKLAEEWRETPLDYDEAGAEFSSKKKARKWIAGLSHFQLNSNLSIDVLPDDPQHLDTVALLAYCLEGRFARPEAFFRALEHFSNAVIPREENARVRHDLQLYALLLVLGELPSEHVPQSQEHNVIQQLVSIYRHHPSRSVHSATGWLLRRWGRTLQVQAIDSHPLPYDPTGWRQWYVLEIDPKKMQGLPDIVDDSPSGNLEPIDLGSPFHITMIAFYPPSTSHSNQSHQSTPGPPFAISDREVPWRWFSPVDGDARRREILGLQNFRNRSPLAPDEPVVRTNWLEATDCLHWFSRGAGFQQQEPSHPDSLPAATQPRSAEESSLRLPTLAEWQLASNASHYRFGHGNDETLLHRYSWFRENAGNIWHPVAQLRPNANGLFDMDGNVSEWLDDRFSTEKDEGRESQEATSSGPKCFRGGHWDSPASLCDNQSVATEKFGAFSTERNSLRGFRVAQTLQTNGQEASSLRLDSSLSQTNP
jgi:formylglycine-generating enzyme required for sulfatase activity